MGVGIAAALQLVTIALQHAADIQQLVATAQSEGRDLTPAELDGLRTRATASIAALEAAKPPAPAV
jgi:hypothetical protein